MSSRIRQAVGLTIALLSVVPLYRLLASRDTGLAGRAAADVADVQSALLWSAILLALIPAILAGTMAQPDALDRAMAAARERLRRPSTMVLALCAGALAGLLTLATTLLVFDGQPTLVDSLVQLIQARYMAAGSLGAPADLPGAFWHVTNTVRTDAGWFSQYPPGHIALLAAGFRIGMPWIIGPVVVAVTAFFAVLTFERLLPGRVALARAAGLGVGLSPFLMAQGAAYMSHAPAAMLAVLAVYFGVRAMSGSMLWSAAAGAAVGALAAVRPMAGVVAAVIVAAAWLPALGARRTAYYGALAALGALPFVAAQLAYNSAAFGSPLMFGYTAAWGPGHGLGFGIDPWGNAYGPLEAILYTSADLTSLNIHLLEIPLPFVAICGLFLLLARRPLDQGERIIAVWSLVPVAANALYWHHGYAMGPRMLAEWAPAWIAFSVVSLHVLLGMIPRTTVLGGRLAPASAALGLVAATVAGWALFTPQRLASYRGSVPDGHLAAMEPADEETDRAIVFVHGSWEARLAGSIGFEGVQLDVVEAALRQNPTCLVQQHLDAFRVRQDTLEFGAARTTGSDALPPLDLEKRSFSYPRTEVAPGLAIRYDPAASFPMTCRRQLTADRFGVTEGAFVFWEGDLPGLDQGRTMFARDLGPELNARLLERYPDRTPWMYGHFTEEAPRRLMPYEQVIGTLWP